MPVDHSVHMKESYLNFKRILRKIICTARDCMKCGDLIVVSRLVYHQKDLPIFHVFFVNGRANEGININPKKWGHKKNLDTRQEEFWSTPKIFCY